MLMSIPKIGNAQSASISAAFEVIRAQENLEGAIEAVKMGESAQPGCVDAVDNCKCFQNRPLSLFLIDLILFSRFDIDRRFLHG